MHRSPEIDETKSGTKDVDDLRQTQGDPQFGGEETVRITSSQSIVDDIQTQDLPDGTETVQLPSHETEENKPIMLKPGSNSVLKKIALWLSIIASSIIIFAFLSGLTSLQESLDFISKTPVPDTLLSGSPRNWLPTAEDIPGEMKLSEEIFYSNEDIARRYDNPVQVLTLLEQRERGDNLHHKYLHRDGCGSKTGFREASIQAVMYDEISGAKEQVAWSKTNLTALLKATGVASVEQIGEAGYIYWYDDNSDCIPPDALRYIGIMFQRYNAIGSIWVGAVKDSVSEDEMQSLATRLAKILDLRFVAEANK